jgi:hypothetical protein
MRGAKEPSIVGLSAHPASFKLKGIRNKPLHWFYGR